LALVAAADAAAPAIPVVRYGTSRYFRTIQFRSDSCKANDTYVPLAYRLDSASFAGATPAYRSDGQDIVVTTKAGVYVVREIPYFAKTDQLGEMWYRDPSVSTTASDTLAIQWGGTDVNVNDTTGVWAATHGGSINYSLVMHFAGNVTNNSPTTLTTGTTGTPTYASAGACIGQYLNLNGSTQWAWALDNAVLRGGNGTGDNPMTVMYWVWNDDFGATNRWCVKGVAATTVDYSFSTLVTTGAQSCTYYDGTTTNRRGRYGKVPSAAAWIHTGVIYAGDENPLGLIIIDNAVRVDSANNTNGTYTASDGDTDTLGIGHYSTDFADGRICDLRIVQSALDSQQVRTAYACEKGFGTNAAFVVGSIKTYVDVDSINPATGLTTGGTSVRIRGRGLLATQGTGTAALLASITAWDDTLITGSTAAGSAGAADVVVFNSDTLGDTIAGGFTYVAPPPPATSGNPFDLHRFRFLKSWMHWSKRKTAH
jgi:hypothetical protein